MNFDLVLLILDKARLPHTIKCGLFLSVVFFKAFDVYGRAERLKRRWASQESQGL